MRLSFLIFWTIVGASLGFVLAPVPMGSSWMAERQTRLTLGITLAGALTGMVVGLIHDYVETRRRP